MACSPLNSVVFGELLEPPDNDGGICSLRLRELVWLGFTTVPGGVCTQCSFQVAEDFSTIFVVSIISFFSGGNAIL